VLLEANAVETPIVATDAEFGTNDVVIDNVTGILVPVGDIYSIANGVVKILKNKNLAKTLADNGKKLLIEKFTPEKTFSKVDEIFKAL
jgi:glycosyltransferase involved in cell wall biosynthesis